MPTVVIPWRAENEHRARAMTWVVDRYLKAGLYVIVAPARPGPWVKAIPVMRGIESAPTHGIVAVADADVWTDGLAEAFKAIEDGEAAWAIPHNKVHRLTEEATQSVFDGVELLLQKPEQQPYTGLEGGGIVVARRETLLKVPLDPRFEGWGQEDHSWGMALFYLLGPAWRGRAPLYHLWHPHPQRLDRKRGSLESWALYKRYYKARYQDGAMGNLIEEARQALKTAGHKDHSFKEVNT